MDLITYYRDWGKDLIIAVIKSREIENFTTIHSYYYNAFMLNKQIFRSGEQKKVLGRHSSSPIVANNPVTNLPIIGEVEYY